MARVKYGGIVTDLAGSVGGSTFQKNQFGSAMRNKPNPIRRRSTSQINIRYFMQLLHAAWRALSDAQRAAWIQFPNYSGQTINRDRGILISGHALFIKYNLAKLIIGDSILEDPTYTPMPEVPNAEGDIGVEVGVMGWALDDTYDDDAVFPIIKLTTPRVPSRSFSPQGLRYMAITIDGNSAISLYTPYTTVFGFAPSAGATLHYTLQWFSRTAPVMFASLSGKVGVVSY